MAVNILERLRALLTEAETDSDDVDPIDAIEAGLDEEGIADIDADESELDADESELDTDADAGGEEPEEGTPGDDEESAETAQLRADILRLTSENEALRNRIAELGGDDIIDAEGAEVIEDEADVVAAFDEDYAAREARLAELMEGK